MMEPSVRIVVTILQHTNFKISREKEKLNPLPLSFIPVLLQRNFINGIALSVTNINILEQVTYMLMKQQEGGPHSYWTVLTVSIL